MDNPYESPTSELKRQGALRRKSRWIAWLAISVGGFLLVAAINLPRVEPDMVKADDLAAYITAAVLLGTGIILLSRN
jgi:hypothetical protein